MDRLGNDGAGTKTDVIIEIATIVTDKDLNILAEGPIIAIHQSDDLLNGMDEWCTNQHGKSGLTQRVKDSVVSESEAEQHTIAFLEQYVPSATSPMCGNSICQDRRFMANYMPVLEVFFHYRNLDVSTLKELANRWSPEVAKGFVKESSHLAMDDIKDSIAEMLYYREHVLKI